MKGFRKKITTSVFCVVLIVGSFFFRYFQCSFTMANIQFMGSTIVFDLSADMICAPLFVYGCAKILHKIGDCITTKILIAIGKKSLLMWFLHCIFFNCTKEITQRILYMPKNPLLVLIFGLLVCYVAAIPLERIVGIISKPRCKQLTLKGDTSSKADNIGSVK